MDPLWIIFAFGFGFAIKQIDLPPLVGFLIAGFVLNIFGVEQSDTLDNIADFGVMLLLFTIGLKLKIRNLLNKQILITSSLHMMITTVIFGLIILQLSYLSISKFSGLSIQSSVLIAFALSFSSTVFAVKILEETGSMKTSHGKLAIGILVIQDIFAVLFLTLSSGKSPSLWAFSLLLLLFIPKLLNRTKLSFILNGTGHGELLILLGVLLPITGAALFELVGLKADLGALTFGVLLADNKRADELSKTMLGFKDLFLVGFFLSIGLLGSPSLEAIGIALALSLLIPLKSILFFVIFTKLKVRARTSVLGSFSLSNYSEFGLIVGAAGVSSGWITSEWLVIFAVALSFSMLFSSILNTRSQPIYARFQKYFLRFETRTRLKGDEPIIFADEEVIVFGMGRSGSEVYRVMSEKYGKKVLGIDISSEVIENHKKLGNNVIQGDATDLNFWQRINMSEKLPLVILVTPSHSTHMRVIEQLDEIHCSIRIAAISRFDDEMKELHDAGVEVVFNLYEEAGFGFANHTFNQIYNSSSSKGPQV
ncbi:cation:proton antiporter family protein [Lutimonas zeaxanthinifaciens]|uniref:cation:proton antiporter family protein n=1 Tax=Lutimonas zeaxanthinifaciens TaxID=3060215 RepID=UPI00265D2F32|nr:cation:proton antiporter family protein [Lutimonas sp. YSD2104]WKK64947.1 cation:proton antiporter [Lutimonas sp. YSD2104]